jgi:hypothetical protein
VIISERKLRYREYKEWGAAIGGDDAYTSLDELQEFNSTDLCSLFVPNRVRKGRPPGPTSDQPPSKRRMLENGSLADMIPEVRTRSH